MGKMTGAQAGLLGFLQGFSGSYANTLKDERLYQMEQRKQAALMQRQQSMARFKQGLQEESAAAAASRQAERDQDLSILRQEEEEHKYGLGEDERTRKADLEKEKLGLLGRQVASQEKQVGIAEAQEERLQEKSEADMWEGEQRVAMAGKTAEAQLTAAKAQLEKAKNKGIGVKDWAWAEAKQLATAQLVADVGEKKAELWIQKNPDRFASLTKARALKIQTFRPADTPDTPRQQKLREEQTTIPAKGYVKISDPKVLKEYKRLDALPDATAKAQLEDLKVTNPGLYTAVIKFGAYKRIAQGNTQR